MSVFLSYPAVLPILQTEWRMSQGEAGLIFSVYQACYLVAVLVLATLTNRTDTRTIYLASATWAGVAEIADPALFGTTLALQSCLGFLAAAVSPGVSGFMLDAWQSGGRPAANSSWPWGSAFDVLGLGVLLGPLSLLALRRPQATAWRGRS